MHAPEIKGISNDLGENFEKILKDNWWKIYTENKFHTSYIDKDKEVTLRFRVKEKTPTEVIVEVEKEIKHISWELPIEKNIVKIII
jgi:uncharacterized protein YqkB